MYPQTGAMFYTDNFEMGKYAELSSGGGCALSYVLWFFSDTTSQGGAISVSNTDSDLMERVYYLQTKFIGSYQKLETHQHLKPLVWLLCK
jgi:hypothetical protein